MERLISLLKRLRGPDGCPWDRAQTSVSLAPFLLEETYELLEAISQSDDSRIMEELGDLLLHIVFQAQLAQDRGSFGLEEVIGRITDKLATRHAHILIDAPANPATTWETRKLQERGRTSLMDGIPRSLPALLRAWRCQQRAAEVGFDWPTVEARWEKVKEEVGELEAAMGDADAAAVADELGDLFFALVSFGRHIDLVAEDVLHKAVTRFSMRFADMERLLAERGIPVGAAGLAEMEVAWREVKSLRQSEPGESRGDHPSTSDNRAG
ncbi:nucleoside triphosphate pyrophosphohydrolase [Candidatus Fermentibacteria bacterium]|nr:nucleoside triphosphate pyrophosphohydrolase [Candidatus Fermentibacteria bacterium]